MAHSWISDHFNANLFSSHFGLHYSTLYPLSISPCVLFLLFLSCCDSTSGVVSIRPPVFPLTPSLPSYSLPFLYSLPIVAPENAKITYLRGHMPDSIRFSMYILLYFNLFCCIKSIRVFVTWCDRDCWNNPTVPYCTVALVVVIRIGMLLQSRLRHVDFQCLHYAILCCAVLHCVVSHWASIHPFISLRGRCHLDEIMSLPSLPFISLIFITYFKIIQCWTHLFSEERLVRVKYCIGGTVYYFMVVDLSWVAGEILLVYRSFQYGVWADVSVFIECSGVLQSVLVNDFNPEQYDSP